LVHPDGTAVVLQRSNAPGDELHSDHGPRDTRLSEVADPGSVFKAFSGSASLAQVVSLAGAPR
jgi:hypothetical protein